MVSMMQEFEDVMDSLGSFRGTEGRRRLWLRGVCCLAAPVSFWLRGVWRNLGYLWRRAFYESPSPTGQYDDILSAFQQQIPLEKQRLIAESKGQADLLPAPCIPSVLGLWGLYLARKAARHQLEEEGG